MADLDEILEIEMPEVDESAQPLQGQTFVITGSLQFYPNRNACKEEIERLGGKVAGSVSSKTTYLVNNDVASSLPRTERRKNWEFLLSLRKNCVPFYLVKSGQV